MRYNLRLDGASSTHMSRPNPQCSRFRVLGSLRELSAAKGKWSRALEHGCESRLSSFADFRCASDRMLAQVNSFACVIGIK